MFAKLKTILSTTASSPADECKTFKARGDEHLRLERLDDAARCYERAVSMNPDYVDARVALGYVLSEQKQYIEAARHLRHALSIDPAIADAHYILGTMSKHQRDHAGAIEHFGLALEVKPDFEFAYRDLIAELSQCGQMGRAKDVLRSAIRIYPDSAEFQFYLGNVFSHEGDDERAGACYRKSLSIRPDSAESHKHLADVLTRQGQIDEAVAEYEHAVALRPEYAGAHMGLGIALESLGRFDEAIGCFRRTTALEPGLVAAHQYLGNCLLERGAMEEAVACYERVLALEPENSVKHLIMAMSGRSSERAPSDYVEKLFDQYADRFDSHLVGTLNYSVPGHIADLLRTAFNPDDEKWIILDLGCGTGLCGLSVAPYARWLVGVDLSSKMLEKARERHLYHRLEQLDLVTMMRGEPESGYDVVLAADVFVYLGKLDDLVDEARRLLRSGGLFAFSVESLDALIGEVPGRSQPDYQLNATARYAHSGAYLSRLAARNGFDVVSTTKIVNRIDKGNPLQGYLALWRRSSAAR
jgi:predicted TPR repeat methyltransferase